MGEKTSKHFCAAALSADRHNRREKMLEHPRPELQPQEKSKWIWEAKDKLSIAQMKAQAAREFAAKPVTVHRKNGTVYVKHLTMPKNAEPVKEAVVVIKEDTDIEDVKRWAFDCQQKYGIRPVGVYLHLDEGHWAELDQKQGQTEEMYRRTDGQEWKRLNDRGNWEYWKPNLHAHVVFDWFNHDTGRLINLDPEVMRKMEDDLAIILQMERGTPSGKRGLDANAYKAKMEAERLARILRDQATEIRHQSKKLQALHTMRNNLIQDIHDKQAKDVELANNLATRNQQITETANRLESLSYQLENTQSRLSSLLIEIADGQAWKSQQKWWPEFMKDRQMKKDMERLIASVSKLTAIKEKDPTLTQVVDNLSSFAGQWQDMLNRARQEGRDAYYQDVMKAARLKSEKPLTAEQLGKRYREYRDRAHSNENLKQEYENLKKQHVKAMAAKAPLEASKKQALDALYNRLGPDSKNAVKAIVEKTTDPYPGMSFEQAKKVCRVFVGKPEAERGQIAEDLMAIANIEYFNEQRTPEAWINSTAEEVLTIADNFLDFAAVFLLPVGGQDVGGGGGGGNNDLPRNKDDDDFYRRAKFAQLMGTRAGGRKKGR